MGSKPAVGVPLGDLRAAVAVARLRGDGSGVGWTAAEWERDWSVLTGPQQQVVYLVAVMGRTLSEAADEIGATRGRVAGPWRRAVGRIRDVLPADR